MKSLACTDCSDVPEEESSHVYEPGRPWTHRPGGRCYPCHKILKERQKKEAKAAAEKLNAARNANALLRPCWTCRGSIGGEAGSVLELRERAGPDRLECPGCADVRVVRDLGPLVLPAPSKRELVAALVSAPDDPWWEARVLHARLYPAKDRRV